MSDIPTIISKVVSKVPDAQVMADLDAAAAWAFDNGGGADSLAATGFCWGGRITWLYAAHNPRLKAAAAWYGRLDGERSQNQPRHPLDLAGAAAAEPPAAAARYPPRQGNLSMDANQDFDSLLPAHRLDRRGFLAGSLAAGFALAARPIIAQTTVSTDATGLIAGEIAIPAAGERRLTGEVDVAGWRRRAGDVARSLGNPHDACRNANRSRIDLSGRRGWIAH